MFSILIYYSALIQLNVFNFHLEGVVFGVIPCLYHRLYATPRSLLAAPSARSARTPRLLLEDSEGRRRDRAHQEGRSKYQKTRQQLNEPAFLPIVVWACNSKTIGLYAGLWRTSLSTSLKKCDSFILLLVRGCTMGCAIPRNSIVVQPCTDECFTLLLVLGVVRGLCRVFVDIFYNKQYVVFSRGTINGH